MYIKKWTEVKFVFPLTGKVVSSSVLQNETLASGLKETLVNEISFFFFSFFMYSQNAIVAVYI